MLYLGAASGGRLEVDQRRPLLDAALRHRRDDDDRHRRGRSERPGRALGRHRREHPAAASPTSASACCAAPTAERPGRRATAAAPTPWRTWPASPTSSSTRAIRTTSSPAGAIRGCAERQRARRRPLHLGRRRTRPGPSGSRRRGLRDRPGPVGARHLLGRDRQRASTSPPTTASPGSCRPPPACPAAASVAAELAIAPSDSNVVYALFASGPSFWRTTDGGATWTQMSSGSNACDGQCWYNMVLRVHRTNPDPSTAARSTSSSRPTAARAGAICPTTGARRRRSTRTCTPCSCTRPIPTPSTSAATAASGRPTNGGSSFINLNGNLNITQFYADRRRRQRPRDDLRRRPGQQLAGPHDRRRVGPAGGHRRRLRLPDRSAGRELRLHHLATPRAGTRTSSRSTSGVRGSFSGITGARQRDHPANDRINWVTPYMLDPVTPTTLYLGTHRVYRSDNHGSSWTQVGPGRPHRRIGQPAGARGQPQLPDVRLRPAAPAAGSGARPTAGPHWTDITAGLPAPLGQRRRRRPDRSRPRVRGGRRLQHRPPLGVERRLRLDRATGAGLPNVPANTVLMLTATDLLVGTDTGVFRSVDGGQTFQPYMDGTARGPGRDRPEVQPAAERPHRRHLRARGLAGRDRPGRADPALRLDRAAADGARRRRRRQHRARRDLERARRCCGTAAASRRWTSRRGSRRRRPASRSSIAGPVGFGDIPSGGTRRFADRDRLHGRAARSRAATRSPSTSSISTTTNPPSTHPDRRSVFSFTVLDDFAAPVVSVQFDEDFDPNPAGGWSHEAVQQGVAPCAAFPYFDEWQIASKDAAHGDSYHCGKRRRRDLRRTDYAWLYRVRQGLRGWRGHRPAGRRAPRSA